MTMIRIVAEEIFSDLRKTDRETGEAFTVYGEARDRYSLEDDSSFFTVGGANALNNLCRKLVNAGIAGAALVIDRNGKPRFTVSSIEAMALTDTRERRGGSLRVVPYLPRPKAESRAAVPT